MSGYNQPLTTSFNVMSKNCGARLNWHSTCLTNTTSPTNNLSSQGLLGTVLVSSQILYICCVTLSHAEVEPSLSATGNVSKDMLNDVKRDSRRRVEFSSDTSFRSSINSRASCDRICRAITQWNTQQHSTLHRMRKLTNRCCNKGRCCNNNTPGV